MAEASKTVKYVGSTGPGATASKVVKYIGVNVLGAPAPARTVPVFVRIGGE